MSHIDGQEVWVELKGKTGMTRAALTKGILVLLLAGALAAWFIWRILA